MTLPACRGSGKSAKKLRKIRASLCAPGPEEDSCNVIATLRHDQSATTESHRNRSLEGSNAGPSHFAALLLVEPITFSPANHYDDSELQPFVTNSFTRLPCRRREPMRILHETDYNQPFCEVMLAKGSAADGSL